MLNTLKHKKVVEKFVKTLFYGEKHSFIEWTYVVGAHWNCHYEAIAMCSNNICIKIPVIIWQIVYLRNELDFWKVNFVRDPKYS